MTKTIIDALQLDDLSEKEQEEILGDLDEVIFKGTIIRLLEQMDEKTRIEFEALLDQDAEEDEIQIFLEKHVPNADAAVQDTIAEITDDILAVTKE